MVDKNLWEVKPRSVSSVCALDGKMYIWRGIIEEYGIPFATSATITDDLDVFDVAASTWRVYSTKGDLPLGEMCVPMCGALNQLFVYGGWRGHQQNQQFITKDLHGLDLKTLKWRKLVSKNPDSSSPMMKGQCGMVEHCGRLCIFGGRGVHSSRERDNNVQDDWHSGDGMTNELHLFDLNTETWSVPNTSGAPPPPCYLFTMTKIDSHRVVIFGGVNSTGSGTDLHILDLDNWHWSGAISQLSPQHCWPSARRYHSACCLVDPLCVGGSGARRIGQKLMVLWGLSHLLSSVGDVWILDVDTMKWTKMDYPDNHGPRVGAAVASVHCSSPCDTMVVCFGGTFMMFGSEPVANLTIMEFGADSLFTSCAKYITSHMDHYRNKLHYLPSHLEAQLLAHQHLSDSLHKSITDASGGVRMY